MRKLLLGLSVLIASLAGAWTYSTVVDAQTANSIYVTSASGSYKVGDSFTVSVRVNTSDPINAVGARLSYSDSLQFVSIDGGGSAFGIDASSTGGSGSVAIDRGTTVAVSGDQLVTKLTFKAVAAGNGSLQMLNGSQALSASTNQDVLSTRNGGTYTVAAPVSGVTTPAPTTPTPMTSIPAPTAPAPKTNNSKTTIAPRGNSTPTPLPGDSTIELSAPATVETTADEGREINKVEYLLNGKLVSTDATPPYSHAIDTTNLANGKYSLTTKTYYEDGKIETSMASLVVNNPFGAKQLWLQLKRYVWLVVLLLAITGGLVYLRAFRGRGNSSHDHGKGGSEALKNLNTGHGAVFVGGSSAPDPSMVPPVATPTPPAPITSVAPPSDKQPPATS